MSIIGRIRLGVAGQGIDRLGRSQSQWRNWVFQIVDDRPVLAVDIGGTKLEVAEVSLDGQIRDRRRRPTRPAPGQTLFDTLAEMVESLGPFDRFQAVGVGCGGPMSDGGELVSPLNIVDWDRFPLRLKLAELTGLVTTVDNDAKALALAEGWRGAAIGCENYLAMVVSTGVGAGIVLNGRLLEGASGNAGHIGHVLVEPDGFPLDGHVPGVLESEASGPGIEARLGVMASEAPESERARAGTMVGRAVGSVANLLDLRLALVAGSVALGYGDVFFAAAQAELDRICQLDFSRGTRIRRAGCGADGPILGAAAVALAADSDGNWPTMASNA